MKTYLIEIQEYTTTRSGRKWRKLRDVKVITDTSAKAYETGKAFLAPNQRAVMRGEVYEKLPVFPLDYPRKYQ